jgi:DNA-binding SARP family transcriptional activator
MSDRGRLSLAAAETSVVVSLDRPRPPAELTDEAKKEWLEVVNRLPAEWFPRETHEVLAQYCRHVVNARRVSRMIEQLMESENFTIDDYEKLLKMQEREGRAISSLATRMRLTQQSTYDSKKTKGRPVSSKPWNS